ncbi:MAG: N-acetylglucosamine-6-phosphate deacetylase [Cohaesibacter sp.]|jgi:N-acetylglucosamine-6-phosphate deacetylase|nr:N-acetylglucosamine-6-phosphate deacetylase [Cohaesibacter sp.]
MKQLLLHARLFDGEQFHAGKAVLLNDSAIEEILNIPAHLAPFTAQGCEIIDLTGLVLAPGFIDCQVNGGGGVMLDGNSSLASLDIITEAHRAYGTTTMLPTLITDRRAAMEHVSDLIRQAHRHWGENSSLGAIKGVHFEGPYLNKARKGVHDEALIRPVEDDGFDAMIALLTHPDLGVRLVTVAPEETGPSFIEALAKQGALVCAGHSAATYQQIKAALRKGLSGFTHLFNAMTPLGNREPGVVGAALDDADSWCGLIADGFHVHPASLRMAIAAKNQIAGRGKMMLVTDAMASVGAEADKKDFVLNGQTITVEHGRCTTADGTLAGSDLDMMGAVRNCVELLDLPLSEALRMASLYPAQFIRMDKVIGRVQPGYAADLVAFDPENWTVKHSWINGFGRIH